MSKHCTLLILFLLAAPVFSADADSLVFQEKDGIVAGEAEHFSVQTKTNVRQWYIFDALEKPSVKPDPDPSHAGSASNKGCIEILPDTRVTDADQLQNGVNFTNTPGAIAVISYWVNFENTGRYYVWVRAYSSGTEDNGIHVGLDDQWPSTGARMQWCDGKNSWTWESKQRTDANHCGEPYKIYLQVNEPGVHKLSFSMREDGFEFDKWILTQERTYRPSGTGPDEWIIFGADSTAPIPPANVSGTLFQDNNVHLTWDAAIEEESSIKSYNVYRNDDFIATLSDTARSFVDTNLYYQSEYSYQISATNRWNMESEKSSPVSLTTTEDTIPPHVVAAFPASTDGIVLTFSEPIAQASAENFANFQFDQGIELIHAMPYKNPQSVLLQTIGHVSGQSYAVTVSGIIDRQGIRMPEAVTMSYTFAHTLWYDDKDATLENFARSRTTDGAIGGSAAYCRAAESAITFNVQLSEKTQWYLWARLFYRGADNDPNSFLLSVDGDTWKKVGNKKDQFQVWHWDGDGKREQGPLLPLSLGRLDAGSHTLVFKAREPIGNPGSLNVFLDGILLTPEQTYQPQDLSIVTTVEKMDRELLDLDYKLGVDAYPNPFNPVVTLSFKNVNDVLDVHIYNPLGQRVAEWTNVRSKTIQWDAGHLSSSMYVVKVLTKDQVATRKIVLLK
jgi:hypothetical protein